MRHSLSKYGVRWALALALIVLAMLQIRQVIPASFIERLDTFIYDARLRVQDGSLDPRIVIVDIDERSVNEVGRWPWSRDTLARLVDMLDRKYFAATVGFDVVFPEPDNSSGFGVLEALSKNELKDVRGFGEQVRALKPRFDYDRRMADALRERPTVLGYFLSNDANAVTKGMLPKPAFSDADLDGAEIDADTYAFYTGNLSQLQAAARSGGFINPRLDADGTIRRVALLAKVGDRYYESLALATARVGLGASAVRPVLFSRDETHLSEQDHRRYGAMKAIRLNSKPDTVTIPLERNLTALINFRGPGGPGGGQFRYVSAVDVLDGKASMDDLAGRIVLVGTTAAGLKDLRSAPTNPNYPGVEMHANIIASILDGSFKREPDFSEAVQHFQVLAIGLFLGLLLPVLTPLMSIAATAAAAAALVAANLAMYQSLNWVVPVAVPLLLGGVLFVFNIAWGYLFEYRNSRAMVNLFGEYVAPELVAEMAANPGSYSMEGESRELTVLFCDVRGFTTISEGLDPNALREYINRYLTAMSEEIRGNRGTLDKYIGDAVMAFWGAPVALPDHAALAVTTALKMQARAAALNADFVARGWPSLKIGIGLNTGDMRVGDMGSKIRRAYTVMGDAVNLSSRLEGITKVYGVGIAVGAATRAAAPEFAYRELDRVRVKGKNEPVPIYEPVAPGAEVNDALRIELDEWHEALELVRTQQWDRAESMLNGLSATYPGTGLYRLYLNRVAHFRLHPPGADWDGVTNFDSK